jgi:hypothetical protein
VDDLDEAIALVYAQNPAGFVSARGTLVKELKAAKRKDDAAAVAALRKPSKLAWAVGDAARREPEAARAFEDAVDALSTPGADVRASTVQLRRAVGTLAAAAADAAGTAGDAEAALLAVAADPEAMAALRQGRLAEVPASGGFGVLGLVAPPEPAERPTAATTADEDAEDDSAATAAAAEAERAEEQRRAEEAADRRRTLERVLADAEAARASAVERVDGARRGLADAEQALDEATATVDAARAALDG